MKKLFITFRGKRKDQDTTFKGDVVAEPTFLLVDETDKRLDPDDGITAKRFLTELNRRLADNPHDDSDGCPSVLFFVHGFNTDDRGSIKARNRIENGLRKHGFKGLLVSIDWPSYGDIVSYPFDRQRVRETAVKLATLIVKTRGFGNADPECRIPINIVAHSMGALLVRETMENVAKDHAIKATDFALDQVVLIAADISSNSLRLDDGRSYGLFQHTARLTNYFSRFDSALDVSNKKPFNGSSRVGRVGLPELAPEKAYDVDTTEYYKTAYGGDNGFEKSHTWYFRDDIFLKDLTETLSGRTDRAAIGMREPATNFKSMRLGPFNIV